MSGKDILVRGFKADAERKAIDYRTQMSLQPWSPICAFELAKYLNVLIWSSDELANRCAEFKVLSEGVGLVDCGWSALTLPNKAGQQVVVHNHTHSSARQQSNVMHELAHIICKHKIQLSAEEKDLPFYLRKHDDKQEAEANCLGSTLQLPQPSLFWAKKRNMENEAIALYFNASTEMVNYRLNISGVTQRLKYRNK